MIRFGSAIVFAACAISCGQQSVPDLFAEGEELYLKGEYDQAIDRFKGHLLTNPDHAGAHFYLGTCYLYSSEQRWLGIAQGELETALSLFNRQGKVNPIPRFNETYFEMMCHINQAKIYLLLIDTLAEDPRAFPGLDARAVVPGLLEKCREHAELAEKVSPGNPDVEQLKQILRQVGMGTPAKPRENRISI